MVQDQFRDIIMTIITSAIVTAAGGYVSLRVLVQRVSDLERRVEKQDNRFTNIEGYMNELRESVARILGILEHKDRQR